MKAFSYLFMILMLSATVYGSNNTTPNNESTRPHIIFILADDLGFNDVGFRGSAQIPTPNIDALAYSGLILDRYYVTPICTPSRSALMTGKYPIHTGMQHSVLYGAEPRGLPLTETLLPEYLNQLGYVSHITGKWHLGNYKIEYTPLYRGFRSHVGFWTGHHDYFDHTAMERGMWGLDMRDGLDVGYHFHGSYSTDIITNEALRVISSHNSSVPLFLYVAHAAVHSGNPYNPLPALDKDVERMSHIKDYGRRRFGAVLSKLDESVGLVVEALAKQNMLNNSIIIFSTDNGGPAEGFNLNYASNWPLRGVKNTLWEGGVRGVGLLWYPKLKKPRRVAGQLFHITDWLPTLLAAAGGQNILKHISDKLDGFNIWEALSEDKNSPRQSVLHNIDDVWGSAAITIGDWKVLQGTNYNGAWDGWYGPAGDQNPKAYQLHEVYRSRAGRAISSLQLMPGNVELLRLRMMARVDCRTSPSPKTDDCDLLISPCLFNIRDDPCENNNLAQKYPSILERVLHTLQELNKTALPPGNQPLNPKGDPKFSNYVWSDFGDDRVQLNT